MDILASTNHKSVYRAPLSTANVLFSVSNNKHVCGLDDHCSAKGHVSPVCSNFSFIAHSLGAIEYFYVMKKTLWKRPFVCYSKHSDLSFANGANVRQSVRCTERTPDSGSFRDLSFFRLSSEHVHAKSLKGRHSTTPAMTVCKTYCRTVTTEAKSNHD